MKNLLIILFFIVFPFVIYGDVTKNLSYQDFISLVLKNNLNIKIYKLNKSTAKFKIEKYRGIFDPVFSTELSKDFKKEFTGSKLQNNVSDFVINRNVDFNFSLTKKLSWGTDLTFSFSNNRFKTNSDWAVLNPMYSSSMMLKISQPLLKNFGVVINRSEILKAENSLHKTESEIKKNINDEILKAADAYFELIYAYNYFQAKKEALQLSRNTLKINRKKVSLGLLPENIIKETEAEVESREEELIKALQNIYNAEDKVKFYMNDVKSDYRIKPVTGFFPDNIGITLDNAIKYALKNREEIKSIEDDLKNAELDILKSENSMKPELNLNIYGAVSGKGEDYGNDIDRMSSNVYHSWGIGFEFSYPVFNREAKARYKIDKLSKIRLELNRKQLENSIILDVKKSYRNLKTLKKRIKANLTALESAFEKMKTEEKKYDNNLSTVFKVFSYQTSYIEQKIKLMRAKTDYSKEILNFYKIIGKKLYTLKR